MFVPLPAGIAEGWMIWCDVARDSTCGNKTWQKSWDRAEMAQTGQNYHYFLKRAENQNDQNLMVVWWYRFTINSPCRTHFRFFCPLLRVTFAKISRQVFTDDSLTYSSFTQISRPVLFWEPETNTLRGFGCAMNSLGNHYNVTLRTTVQVYTSKSMPSRYTDRYYIHQLCMYIYLYI